MVAPGTPPSADRVGRGLRAHRRRTATARQPGRGCFLYLRSGLQRSTFASLSPGLAQQPAMPNMCHESSSIVMEATGSAIGQLGVSTSCHAIIGPDSIPGQSPPDVGLRCRAGPRSLDHPLREAGLIVQVRSPSGGGAAQLSDRPGRSTGAATWRCFRHFALVEWDALDHGGQPVRNAGRRTHQPSMGSVVLTSRGVPDADDGRAMLADGRDPCSAGATGAHPPQAVARSAAIVEAFAGNFGKPDAVPAGPHSGAASWASTGRHRRRRRPAKGVSGPFAAAAARLDEIPAFGPVDAAIFLGRRGNHVGRFPTAGHLCSGPSSTRASSSSAGKTKGIGSTGHGNRYLARVLGEAAVVAGCSDTFLGERYRRIARRRGTKRAEFVAVADRSWVPDGHLLADTPQPRPVQHHDLRSERPVPRH